MRDNIQAKHDRTSQPNEAISRGVTHGVASAGNRSAIRNRTATICVVGQGYVGVPLAARFDQAGFDVVGFDVSTDRVESLESGIDPTGDVGDEAIRESDIEFTTDARSIAHADYVIVAVPTPVNDRRDPNLEYVESAGKTIGRHVTEGTTIVLESTVFPGATREVLAPAIESESGLKAEEGFSIGYSPERLVPGDEEHTLENVIKIVSGQDENVTDELAELYGTIVDAGIHEAPEIEVAEAAKCVENIQRDINIALVNELAITCDNLGVDTQAVLDAAGTKWNFHDYRPGIVGGHCIPVDPFFLIYQSEKNGFDPELVSKAREVNDYVPKHVAKQTIKALNESDKVLQRSRVLVLGLTYKPNVSDIRTSNIDATIEELEEFGVEVVGYDPNADADAMADEFDIEIQDELSFDGFDAVIVGAAHEEFSELNLHVMAEQLARDPVFVDPENAFADEANAAGIDYWRL